MSKNILFNPKFKTKQVYDLAVFPTETPSTGELFFWLTYESGKIYGNYRINGVAEDKKYEITDPTSFNSSQVFTNKVKAIYWNAASSKIVYSDEAQSYDVPVTGFITGASFDSVANALLFPVSGSPTPISIALPIDFKKHISSGFWNQANNNLTFTYSDSTIFSIDLSSLVRNYTAIETSSISASVSNSNEISANLKISEVTGNQIQIRNDGIFVPAFEDADMSDYATQTDLNGKVDKVTGKTLSTNDFTTELKEKLEGLNDNNTPLYKKIAFTKANDSDISWSGSVATFTHNLNCFPVCTIYNSDKEQVLFGAKVVDANSFTVDFVDKTLISGSWIMIVNYGAPYA